MYSISRNSFAPSEFEIKNQSLNDPSGQNRRKAVRRSAFLLIRHSKVQRHNCQKCTPTDCLSGDFTHWTKDVFTVRNNNSKKIIL